MNMDKDTDMNMDKDTDIDTNTDTGSGQHVSPLYMPTTVPKYFNYFNFKYVVTVFLLGGILCNISPRISRNVAHGILRVSEKVKLILKNPTSAELKKSISVDTF
jgi:hypothetical protein